MCAYRALNCGDAELINDARLIEEVRRGIGMQGERKISATWEKR